MEIKNLGYRAIKGNCTFYKFTKNAFFSFFPFQFCRCVFLSYFTFPRDFFYIFVSAKICKNTITDILTLKLTPTECPKIDADAVQICSNFGTLSIWSENVHEIV